MQEKDSFSQKKVLIVLLPTQVNEVLSCGAKF